MKTKNIQIADIRIDGGTQQRCSINTTVVEEYAESMRCGSRFPAITVFFDGAQNWLADGFHRYHAGREVPALDILADVHEGTVEDAVLFSAGANRAHGLHRSNADKVNSVNILLTHKKWSTWSDHDIAKHCGVSQPFVSKMRKKESGEESATAKNVEQPQKPVHKDNAPESTKVITVITTPPEPSTGFIPENPAVTEEVNTDVLEGLIADNESMVSELVTMHKIVNSDDKLVVALAEIKTNKELARIMAERFNGIQNEKNELIRLIKSRDHTIKKLEKKVTEQADQIKTLEAGRF